MVVHGLALDAATWYVKGALDTAGQDNGAVPEEWNPAINLVVNRVVEEYIAKRFAGLPLPAPEELVSSYIPPAELEAMRRKLNGQSEAQQAA